MNRRLLIPLGAGVLIVLLWFVALWGPQGSALSSAKKRKSQAEAQGATLRDQLTRLQQARRDQPLKQSQLETLRVAIPDDPNLAQFILDANDAASRSGIDFLSITPSVPTAPSSGSSASTVPGGGSATAIPIRIGMTISGGYFQVLDFVNRLNTLPRIVVVDTLAISGSAATSQLSVTLSERIFTTSAASVSSGSTTTTINPAVTTTTRAGGA